MIRRARMHPYLVQHVLKIATQRARLMHLRLSHSQRDTKRAVLVMLERMADRSALNLLAAAALDGAVRRG